MEGQRTRVREKKGKGWWWETVRRAAKPLPRFDEGAREAGSGGVHDESGREVSP